MVLLSERAFGMAGAVTGSATGPAAAYYNPGGLADTSETAAGASLSVQGFRSYTLENGFTSFLGTRDLGDSELLSVPIFVGAVLKFGDRDETRIRRHALAAGTLIGRSLDRDLGDDAADLGRRIAVSLELNDDVERRWYYGSYAFRPNHQFSVGVTAAVSVLERRFREFSSQAIDFEASPTGSFTGRLTTRSARVDLSAVSLVFRVGGSWRPVEWLQISATFQVPGIELFESGRAFFERATADSAGGSGFFRSVDESVDVDDTIPWQLRLGAYARFTSWLGVGLDLGLIGPEGSEADPIHPLGQALPRDESRPASTFFPDGYWTDVALDAALGAEFQLADEVPLRIGSALELSGVRRGSRESYAPDRLHRITFTAAVGVRGDRYDFGIGAGYTYGFGTGLRPLDLLGGAYAFTDVQSHEVTFFFSGVTGAATELALESYREITGSELDEDAAEREAQGDGGRT